MGLWGWCPCSDGPKRHVLRCLAVPRSYTCCTSILWLSGHWGWRAAPRVGCCSSAPCRACVRLSCWPAVLATQGWLCWLGERVAGGCGEGHGGCFWVAAASLNICHVPALITVIGCRRAVLAPALAPRGSVSSSGVWCSVHRGVPVPTFPFVRSPEACSHMPVGTRPMQSAHTRWHVPVSSHK